MVARSHQDGLGALPGEGLRRDHRRGHSEAAAGISRSTYFRYFATKEDVVVGSLVRFGGLMLEALQARPEDADIWAALRVRHLNPMVDGPRSRGAISGLQVARMIQPTPSLRSVISRR